MDTLRSDYGSHLNTGESDDFSNEDVGVELPVLNIGTDERRMPVRAYNHWASHLAGRNFPAFNEADLTRLPDFGARSVLLNFTDGYDNPKVTYLGSEIAKECGAQTKINHFADVPPRTLLSCITSHYMHVITNKAPFSFEAEFVNQRLATILYRGVLLPYSSDGVAIDYVYGVISWKEAADDEMTKRLEEELRKEIEAKTSRGGPNSRGFNRHAVLTEWADSPLGNP